MENEIQIFFNNVRLLGPEVLDLDGLQKQYRVPVNSQMFQKSNHKGMALLIKPLLCFFNEGYTALFETSWFPFGLAQMKPFKETCLFCAKELQDQGRLQEGIVTKNIIENAVGIKMWHALRRLSDAIVEERIRQLEQSTNHSPSVGGTFDNLSSNVEEELGGPQLKLMGRALKVNIM